MSLSKHYPLRKVAEKVLVKHLGDLDVAVRNELATSLVRQWLTNDGHAGLVFPTRKFWFDVAPKGDGVEVGFGTFEGNWGRALVEDWHVNEEEVPGLLCRLNLCQSVLCRNADGRTIRLWIEAKERTVRCNEEPEA